MNDIEIEIPGKPFGKQRPRVTFANGYARAYTPDKTVNYEEYIKLLYLKVKNNTLYDKPLKVTIKAFFGIPDSFSKKKKESALRGDIRPTVKPDTDNIAKICCDALNGLAYKDDSQITTLSVTKCYSEMPKVIIKIEEDKEE